MIFAIDRAGISGRDGKTHQGTFDLSFLSHIPNLVVMAPKNKYELEEMLRFAVNYNGPVAIRYPKGDAYSGLAQYQAPMEYGTAEKLMTGDELAILAVGSMVKTGAEIVDALNADGIKSTLINVRFVVPMDKQIIEEVCKDHKLIVTLEENVRSGGYGQKVADYLCEADIRDTRLLNIAVPDQFIEHGGVNELHQRMGLDKQSIIDKIKELL